MKNIYLLCAVALSVLFFEAFSVKAQTVPPFKITAIKLLPFDKMTGKLEAEIMPKEERTFFNELYYGLFATVEISGQTGNYTPERKIEITVFKGKTLKIKQIEEASVVGEGNKYFVPVYLDSASCSEITVTAKIIGQKTASTMTRKAKFACGE